MQCMIRMEERLPRHVRYSLVSVHTSTLWLERIQRVNPHKWGRSLPSPQTNNVIFASKSINKGLCTTIGQHSAAKSPSSSRKVLHNKNPVVFPHWFFSTCLFSNKKIQIWCLLRIVTINWGVFDITIRLKVSNRFSGSLWIQTKRFARLFTT